MKTLTLSFVTLALLASVARAADTYQVDSAHSTILFKVDHLGAAPAYGRVNEPAGSVTLDDADPANSSFTIEAKTANIDTANAKRDEHLRGPDFFNAKQFPVLTFKSTSVSKAGETAYAVTGDLTVHGVTKPVIVTLTRGGPNKDPRGNYRVGFHGTFAIKRSDYGINYMPDGLGDAVELTVSFEATRK